MTAMVWHLALAYRTPTLLLLGLILAALALLAARRTLHPLRLAQVLLQWFLLCCVGVEFVWVAALLALPLGAADWAHRQLGLAALGCAVTGVASAFGGVGMRLAALSGPTVWIVGGLLSQPAGRAGLWALPDLLVPVVGFLLLGWQYRAQRHRSVFARSRL